jgi:hypothetical protein
MGSRGKTMDLMNAPARMTMKPLEMGGNDAPPSALDSPAAEDSPPLRSVHTSNFSSILQELGISVLVSTYQAGKLVMHQLQQHRRQRDRSCRQLPNHRRAWKRLWRLIELRGDVE